MATHREQDTSASDGARGPSPAARRLLWILAYYALMGAALALAWRVSPAVRELVQSDRLRALAEGGTASRSQNLTNALAAAEGATGAPGTITLLALLGALATALPVAWVYSLTRRRKGFDQSMVHTIILLPVAVAGMVVLIQNSLALAFSLAGIVALLRFRNTLDDTKDGVYVFVVTTVGISAATGVLVVGIVSSIVFNALVLGLWWVDFAREPTPGIRGGIRRLARLPALTPVRARPAAARAGNGHGTEAARTGTAAAWRRQLGAGHTAEFAAPDGQFNARIRVHTMDARASQPVVEGILNEQAKRWELVGVMPDDAGRVTLKYLLRLRKRARGELLTAVRERGAPQVVGVEFR